MVAAEKIEFDGIRNHFDIRALDWKLDFAAMSVDQKFVYVANGPGKALAAKAVSTACDGLPITKIVSTGFCGALAPSLSIGAIVIANRVEEKGSGQVYSTSSMVSPGGVIGAIVTCDRVAVTVEEKKSLASGGAIAVEMEAAAVAAEATRRRVPFYCIRVVSDTAQENMPLDFNRYRRADGRFDRTGIAVAALLRPFTRIPALRTLQRNCRAASAQLGDFVAKCNF